MKYKIGDICSITEEFISETFTNCPDNIVQNDVVDFVKEFAGKKVRITKSEFNEYKGNIYTGLLLNPFKYSVENIEDYCDYLDYNLLSDDIKSTDDAIYLLFYEKELNKPVICYEI